MSDFKIALVGLRKQTATHLFETLRDIYFPEDGVDSRAFADMIRLFLACGIDVTEFATSMGVSVNTIYGWAHDNPPKSSAQKAVVDWITQYLLDRHVAA